MRMKPEHVRRLVELSQRGNNTPAVSVIIARRFARHLRNEGEHYREHFKAQIAAAKAALPFAAAKAALPFTAAKLAELERQQEDKREVRKRNLLAIADWLRRNDSVLVDLYGFHGICDLLAVNPVHRGEAKEYMSEGSGTITTIAFICGLEDSAITMSGRNKPDWKDGPLFNAFHRQMMQVMQDNPGAMPDPFAPDGPFYGVPTYTRMPDGAMVRNAPTVTVHDATGSRVVKGKPGGRHADAR